MRVFLSRCHGAAPRYDFVKQQGAAQWRVPSNRFICCSFLGIVNSLMYAQGSPWVINWVLAMNGVFIHLLLHNGVCRVLAVSHVPRTSACVCQELCAALQVSHTVTLGRAVVLLHFHTEPVLPVPLESFLWLS